MWYYVSMRTQLACNNFSAFKVLSGIFVLFFGLAFPATTVVTLMILAIGKAHSVGAYLGMWRAGKLNIKLITWITFITALVSYLGVKVADYHTLWLVSVLLFVFHFIYDEIDLQQESFTSINIFLSLTPFALLSYHVVSDFLSSNYNLQLLIILFAGVSFLEFFLIKEINWLYIQTKTISIFSLFAMYLGLGAEYAVSITLLYHYLYWFIFPAYKLHKYNRKERDGFIMMLFIIALTSVFIYSTRVWAIADVQDEIAMRSFFIASSIHVLTTAPFAYFFGLAKPQKHGQT